MSASFPPVYGKGNDFYKTELEKAKKKLAKIKTEEKELVNLITDLENEIEKNKDN